MSRTKYLLLRDGILKNKNMNKKLMKMLLWLLKKLNT